MAYQPPSEKWRNFENVQPSISRKRLVCIQYHMVGQSIASISNLSSIFTVAPQVGYIGNGPPYYYILQHMCPCASCCCIPLQLAPMDAGARSP